MSPIFIFKVYSIYKDTFSLEEKFKRIEHILNYIHDQLMHLENNFSFYSCIGVNKIKIISDNEYIKFKELHKKNFKNQQVKAILLAPEYFLSLTKQKKIILNEEKLLIENKIHKLSEKYKNILILLGTIASEKKYGEKNTKSESSLYETMNKYKDYVKEKKSRGIDFYKSPYEFYKSTIIDDKTKNSSAHLKYLIQHEFNMYNIRDTKNFSDRVGEYHGKKSNFNLISNKTFGYLSGKRIVKYNKIAGYDEEDDYSNQLFMPGIKSEKIYQNGVGLYCIPIHNDKHFTLGIEICFDHFQGVGKKFWQHSPDIHLILSAGVMNNIGNFKVKQNGYVIHASTFDSEDKIFHYKNLSFNVLNEIANKVSYGKIFYNLKCGLIYL
ncbi:hypothetical protein QEJ31_03100 [Pigmentibacter sp. JX0631]|uniref:hypothetical protein n=1 Tax=Pigmentibacter sp. JX0631 TaxID=2976982 RepID=UPI002468C708|nr:hypothetical protein [Pigmentibacter sp. JX0631]WGL60588.1 hypothetical protein QEJ31_03100 [Pigmentibacter sp. JX0631]